MSEGPIKKTVCSPGHWVQSNTVSELFVRTLRYPRICDCALLSRQSISNSLKNHISKLPLIKKISKTKLFFSYLSRDFQKSVIPKVLQETRWNKFCSDNSTNRNINVFFISMINHRKLPKFHHIPLQGHRFPINCYYLGGSPNIVTVYDRPYVLDFPQQAVLQKTLSLSL